MTTRQTKLQKIWLEGSELCNYEYDPETMLAPIPTFIAGSTTTPQIEPRRAG